MELSTSVEQNKKLIENKLDAATRFSEEASYLVQIEDEDGLLYDRTLPYRNSFSRGVINPGMLSDMIGTLTPSTVTMHNSSRPSTAAASRPSTPFRRSYSVLPSIGSSFVFDENF